MNHAPRLVLAGFFALGCGSSGNGSPSGGGGSPSGGASGKGGATGQGGGVGGTGGAASACVPTVPAIAWTNPYAGWSRGIPTATDPTFFPIAVWLQGSWHATEMGQLGINIYVGNNAGTDSLAAADLAILKAQGI
jgi:hypothetical protein